ncbi:ketoacyl-ACP synthase III [Undibacterium sp. Dicai25W]|uniref:ketoacyl-ACP synthase III n=1 Tax=Undibacterium sp. Dicai25W TaxID=3413034 RepID=UPI003BF1395E
MGTVEDVNRTARICGVEQRYIAPSDVCASDLCYTAAEALLDQIRWEKSSVDLLIYLTQTPDYIVPATSCVLHERIGLSHACGAFDMGLGCSGYVYALMTAFSMLAKQGMKRILLLVGDTPSKMISPFDIPANILFGDAGTATAITFDEDAGESHFVVGTNGAGSKSLIIPAGAYRQPSNEHTSVREVNEKDGSARSLEDLYMDGAAVFGLTLKHVPALVDQLYQVSGWKQGDVSQWLFHQANQFMVEYFAKKFGVTEAQFPMNVARFGNTSPSSIPLLMVSEQFSARMESNFTKMGMIGFGVGFSWGGAFLEQKRIQCLPLIYQYK